jgi:uncharacterized membrane protein YagU involved in acid resistance
MKKTRATEAILYAGLLAGTMDLTAAFIVTVWQNGNNTRMLQSIASGFLGALSFQGGKATAVLGVLTHFTIAFIWTIVFYLLSRRIKFLTAKPIVSGVLYGIAVYFLMYYVVVPHSAAPFKMPHTFNATVKDVLIHIVCVGLPIALVTRRFAK